MKNAKSIKNEIWEEEKCECGTSIPRGFGYYNYGKALRCFMCGKVNKKSINSAPKSGGIKIIDVKRVALCSKCRTQDDEIPRYKNREVVEDKDIVCICASLGECKHKAHFNSAPKGCEKMFKPFGDSEEETSWKCGDKWNGRPLLCPDCKKLNKQNGDNA